MSYQDFVDFDKYLLGKKERIIHQIWFGTIPNDKEAKKAYDKLKIYRDSWVIKNPGWSRVEWSKEFCIELIKKFYPEHMDIFNNYKYEIQRCDMIRYFILDRYGGWYADMDYYCNRPLDEAMNVYKNNIYFVETQNTVIGQSDNYISNSLMYSVKNHSFWNCVMIELEKSQKVPIYYSRHLEVMFTTGPAFLNRMYTQYKYKYKLKSLPWKLFHPYGVKDDIRSINLSSEIFTAHVNKGSWCGKDSMFFNTILIEWKIIIGIIIVMFFPILIYRFGKNIKCLS